MIKKKQNPEDIVPTPLTVTLKAHVVRDLKDMEKNSRMTVDEIVHKAVSFFIATHSDFLTKK